MSHTKRPRTAKSGQYPPLRTQHAEKGHLKNVHQTKTLQSHDQPNIPFANHGVLTIYDFALAGTGNAAERGMSHFKGAALMLDALQLRYAFAVDCNGCVTAR